MAYLYLAIAIISGVAATSAIKASNRFSNPLPSTLVIITYSVVFYCLALVLKSIPVGIAYAVWSGLGIALISPLASQGTGPLTITNPALLDTMHVNRSGDKDLQ
ncbi:MAG: multidrug efflux SMR transporter [Halioglobus sp.]|nr:multidrug efflux SMR transporter [Halioglobus sp.]